MAIHSYMFAAFKQRTTGVSFGGGIMKRLYAFAVVTVLFLSSRAWAATGTAIIEGTADGSDIQGTLKFEDTDKGLKVTGNIDNIPSGEHGFHIHEFGDCSDEAKAAGGHFNPGQHPHGLVTKDGVAKVHAGDMGNLVADKEGKAQVNILIPGVTLNSGKFDVAGRAVIVHEKTDDFGQPVGNAGSRIACGPIVLTAK
jgi:Cu-Zn family superoxide dismutase